MLITRPADKGLPLAKLLGNMKIKASCQSFFDYKAATDTDAVFATIEQVQPDIIIFVSSAAVQYAQTALPIKTWLKDSSTPTFIAVGKATEKALIACNIVNVVTPEQHTSEGLLTLSVLQQVANKRILIVRGDGGRELIKEQLMRKGANVDYLETYRRDWVVLPATTIAQWQQNMVNIFVITSNALLQRIVDLFNRFMNTLAPDELVRFHQWKNTCSWVVASERIASNAKLLGLKQVINANGANDQAIIDAILN